VKLPQKLQHVHTQAIISETVKTNLRSADVQNKPHQTKPNQTKPNRKVAIPTKGYSHMNTTSEA